MLAHAACQRDAQHVTAWPWRAHMLDSLALRRDAGGSNRSMAATLPWLPGVACRACMRKQELRLQEWDLSSHMQADMGCHRSWQRAEPEEARSQVTSVHASALHSGGTAEPPAAAKWEEGGLP